MNWAHLVRDYGDLFAVILLMLAVGSALAIVLRGFQSRHWTRNAVSLVGIILCSLLAFASIHFLRSTPSPQAPSDSSPGR
jgi:hypothetical protein